MKRQSVREEKPAFNKPFARPIWKLLAAAEKAGDFIHKSGGEAVPINNIRIVLSVDMFTSTTL
jgi:hypothetical protein